MGHEIEIEEIKKEEQEKEQEQENQQNYEQGKGWGRWVGSVVRKAAIVSAVAVAAPVVIPPAIVLLTLGGAFSLPFDVYLGTVALTDKFMSYLLPHQVPIEEEPRGEWHVWFEEEHEDHNQVINLENI